MMSSCDLDIILMLDNELDTVGGEQESTKIIMNGLKEKFIFGVIQPGDIKELYSNVEFYKLTKYTRIKHLIKRPVMFIQYIVGIRRIIKSSNPKLIHTQGQVSFFIVALLKKYRLISKDVYLIHTERGLFLKYNAFFKDVFYFFMKELNTLITTTEFNMKYWKDALAKKGIKSSYLVIENTAGELFEVYDNGFNNEEEKVFTIGFAGRYCDWKNWPLAIDISMRVNEILGDKINVKMAVGCLDNKALRATKKMFLQLSNVLGNRFDGRINIGIEEMDRFYYDIDVFILTSNYNTESFGRTLVEAMSRKTVVLTTDAGGSVEVVGNPDNVLRTANEFVERITQFYHDKEKMKREKERNLQRVKNFYSLENNLKKHKNLYDEVINKIT